MTFQRKTRAERLQRRMDRLMEKASQVAEAMADITPLTAEEGDRLSSKEAAKR